MAQQHEPSAVSETDGVRSFTDQDPIYQAFDSYPWAKDEAFLSGLAAILQNAQDSPADIATRARIFYYAQRIGVQIDFDRYREWLARHPDHHPPQVLPQNHLDPSKQTEQPQGSALPWQQAAPKAELYLDRKPTSGSADEAGGEPNYPMAFAEMLQLLQEGKTIPGIKQIPNTVARDRSVKPVGARTAPKKPWEKNAAAAIPEAHLPQSLDEDFPPLETEASETAQESAASACNAHSNNAL
ncbi:hypothetical protein RJ55_00121 [Drechmeria coniospora]|nr:hypothetical protein RJ55_00121 [Drechmeria coniospora]